MSQQKIADWLERNQLEILHRYMEAARDPERFPSFSALKPGQLRAVMKREVRGLISYLAENETELDDVKQIHKEQAMGVTDSIPVEEQLKFLERRLEILHTMFSEDASTENLRTEFQLQMDNATRFYRINTRKIEFDRQLGGLVDR